MLIRDQHDWPMPGGSQLSVRRLRVWRLADGSLVAVVSESGPGISITNVAREAYGAIAAEYGGEPLRVFEHYPDGGRDLPERLDEIRVADGHVGWRRCTSELVDLVGPGVLLGPRPQRQESIRRAATAAAGPPSGPGLAPGTTIHGEAPGRLVTVVGEDGQVLGLLPHWRRHSAEFCWGYLGSGPAELARCILIAVLGGEARCQTCGGTGYLVYDEASGREITVDPGHTEQDTLRCIACDGGFTVTPALYQRFKHDVIAGLPDQEWMLSVSGIRSWLTAAHGG